MEWTLLFFGCRMPKSYSRIARWPSPRQISPQSVHCTGGGIAPKKVDVFADNALSCKVCDKRLCHQGFEFRIVLMSMDRGLYFVHPLSFYPQKRSERNVSVYACWGSAPCTLPNLAPTGNWGLVQEPTPQEFFLNGQLCIAILRYASQIWSSKVKFLKFGIKLRKQHIDRPLLQPVHTSTKLLCRVRSVTVCKNLTCMHACSLSNYTQLYFTTKW